MGGSPLMISDDGWWCIFSFQTFHSPEAAKAAPKRTRQSRKRQAVPEADVPAAVPDDDAVSQEVEAAEEKGFPIDQWWT